MRRFLAGKVSIVEDGRMDGYYEEVEKYRNKRNYVPLVPATSPSYPLRPPRTRYVPLVPATSPSYPLSE
jgi:hypothetical protein